MNTLGVRVCSFSVSPNEEKSNGTEKEIKLRLLFEL